MPEQDDFFYALVIKQLQNDITDQELELLNNWKNASAKNFAMYQSVGTTWELTNFKHKDFNADAAWNKVSSRLEGLSSQGQQALNVKVNWFPAAVWKIAAAVILVVGIGLLMTRFFSSDKATIISAVDEIRSVYLPDSSLVVINRHSQLRYDKAFKSNRVVSLLGEAYFEVRKNQGQQFQVKTKRAIVTVLGTSFNVKAYARQTSDDIEVFTGKVKVASAVQEDNKWLILTRGMAGKVDSTGPVIKKSETNPNTFGWQMEKLVFDNTPLDQVVIDLEEYFKISIVLMNDSLKGCRFTGTFEKPKIDQVLRVIKVSSEINYTKTLNGYQISGAGCK